MKDEILTNGQSLDIADLIYDTDRYIYPALFASKNKDPNENARRIIRQLLQNGRDAMFCKSNIYADFDKSGRIVGIILWNKGGMEWDYRLFMEEAALLGIALIEENVRSVMKSYIEERYGGGSFNRRNAINVINVCVKADARNKGIGKAMLDSFVSRHGTEPMELCVLCDNEPAITLYQKAGFKIVSQTEGFSMGSEKPLCYTMERLFNRHK